MIHEGEHQLSLGFFICNNRYLMFNKGKMIATSEFKLVWSKIDAKEAVCKGVLAALLFSLINAFVPFIFGKLVDAAIQFSSPFLISSIILVWASVSLLRDALERYSSRISYEVGIDLFSRLHLDVIKHITQLPLQYHKENKIPETTERLNKGIDEIYDLIEHTIFSFFPTMLTFLAAICILLAVQWELATVLIIASFAYVLITHHLTYKIVDLQLKWHQSWARAFGDRHDSWSNIEAVKSAINEEIECRKNLTNFTCMNQSFKAYRASVLALDVWQKSILTLSFIAVVGMGAFMLRAGRLSPGTMIMFVGYVGLLTAPLSRIADQYAKIKGAFAAFKTVAQFFSIPKEMDSPDAIKLDQVRGDITFEKVCFSHKKEKNVLKDISFEVKSGETMALVGKSGVGKTTLVNLIGRFYLPQAGRILIDENEITSIQLKSLRNNIVVVPQDVMLFNDTIQNNIAYGKVDATITEIREAAKAANADDFIESFSEKYQQVVGERGIKLSTGQKQRIAIARALLRNPRILILDEATSALDSVSEKLVQEAISRLIRGRTTIIIAHRLSTIRQADKIVVLDDGKVCAVGKHLDLLNTNCLYKRLWDLQYSRDTSCIPDCK